MKGGEGGNKGVLEEVQGGRRRRWKKGKIEEEEEGGTKGKVKKGKVKERGGGKRGWWKMGRVEKEKVEEGGNVQDGDSGKLGR